MNRSSRTLKALLPLTVATAVVGLGAPAQPVRAEEPPTDSIARGKYLVTVAVCNDCHTPAKMGPNGPEPDMSRMLSGHPEDFVLPPAPSAQGPWIVSAASTATAWAGPWGTSFTANLTPDPETGLGRWTLRNFVDAIRSGRHMGRGRPVLPPMPVAFFKHFTDEDLAAIFAYLGTIPPIHNRVPEPLPPAAAGANAE
jgi:hypothetical protein